MRPWLRPRAVRNAVTALCGVVLAGTLVAVAVAAPADGRDHVPAASHVRSDDAAATLLTAEADHVWQALRRDRATHGVPPVSLDPGLAASARRDACAMARGDRPLISDARRMAEAGAQRENVGLVVDDDPVTGAQTMHEWWATTAEHRRDRLAAEARRYGIGACTDGDRTYYVERLAR
jgi:uncharacterized protein YkwD